MCIPRKAYLLLVLMAACSKPLPHLEGMDLDKWKEDKSACHGNRQAMEEALQKEYPKLKGLSEMEIVHLFGRPDENELYKRNQKFYSYFISPGPDCLVHDLMPDKLVIRFNAMGYAQLVSIDRN